jgi:hypothetical protein
MLLQETSYTNGVWMRLMPGSNTLRFDGPTGAGQMLVTVTWVPRY